MIGDIESSGNKLEAPDGLLNLFGKLSSLGANPPRITLRIWLTPPPASAAYCARK